MSSLIAWILRAIPFGTIIMYGALGETLTEKSGNLNLGVPGIMYLGGFAGFASAYYYEKLSANPSAFVQGNVTRLKAGSVFVNNYNDGDMTVPFGGYKQSGNGRDKSLHALEKFTELKTIWIALEPQS